MCSESPFERTALLQVYYKGVLQNHATTSIQLHPPPLSSFQLPPSSLQHPQRYKSQYITRNWAISLNLGRKILNCPFSLKIGTYGILEVVILNPDLNFWTSNRKIHFCRKSQSCPFCLKFGTQGISRMFILILTLVFLISKSKLIFEQIWAENVKVLCFAWKLAQLASWRKWNCPFCLKIATHGILE